MTRLFKPNFRALPSFDAFCAKQILMPKLHLYKFLSTIHEREIGEKKRLFRKKNRERETKPLNWKTL